MLVRVSKCCLALLLSVSSLAAAPAESTIPCHAAALPDRFIVLDMSKEANAANRVYIFDESLPAGKTIQTLLLDKSQVDAGLQRVRAESGQTTTRWITARGFAANIYCVFDSTESCAVDVLEEKRKSQFETDLETLKKIAGVIRGSGNEAKGKLVATCQGYTLTEQRAFLTVEASLGTDAEKVSSKIVTGPIEHWYISADIPVNDVEQLKYDKESKALVPKKDPSSFLIGVNFKLGDLLTEDSSLGGNLVIKGLFKASKEPLDAYGVGIALRGQYFDKWGIDLDAFSPFVAWVTSREDEIVDGVVKESNKRKSDLRAGISLNLDKALAWITPKKGNGK